MRHLAGDARTRLGDGFVHPCVRRGEGSRHALYLELGCPPSLYTGWPVRQCYASAEPASTVCATTLRATSRSRRLSSAGVDAGGMPDTTRSWL